MTLSSENLTLDYCSLTQTVYVINFMKKTIQKNVQVQKTIDLSNFPLSSKYY